MVKNQIFAALLVGFLSIGSSVVAQDNSDKKEEKRVMLVYMKDGKKHVLNETYTGEMSEELKKKIAAFKTEMGDEHGEIHIDTDLGEKMDGKHRMVFVTDGDGKTEGEITAKIKMSDGTIKEVKKHFDSPEEMKQIITELKGTKDGELLTLDVQMNREEVIEVDGDIDGVEGAMGHVVVEQDGKILIDETFEGTKIPENIQSRIDQLKGSGKPINVNVDIQATGDKKMHDDGQRRVIIKKNDGEWKELDNKNELHIDGKDGKKHVIKVEIEDDFEMRGDDERAVRERQERGASENVWIEKDGNNEGGKYEYVIETVDVEDVDGVKKTIVKVIISQLSIEDITDADKERIPSNLRQPEGDSFGEAMDELNFYPNPNKGEFDISFNLKEKGDTKIEVIDLTGKVVFEDSLADFSGAYKKHISMIGQAKGLYILKIAQNNRVMTKKVVLE